LINNLDKLNLNDLCQDSKRFVEDIQKEPDRSVPIVAVAFLDDVLKQLLEAYFVDDKKTVRQLLDYPGALSSFAARADMAYCLGLIPVKSYKDIVQIRKIRNKFSHSHMPVSFENKDIADMCEKLHYFTLISNPADFNCLPRDQFLIAAIMITNLILIKALGLKKAQNPKDYEIAQIVKV
jgi:DNA-binding MltR family transcriptional regulator